MKSDKPIIDTSKLDINAIVEDMRKETLDWDLDTIQKVFYSHLLGTGQSFKNELSRHIRNKYGFWKCTWTPKLKGGVDHSPLHPDAISQTIIDKILELGPYETN